MTPSKKPSDKKPLDKELTDEQLEKVVGGGRWDAHGQGYNSGKGRGKKDQPD